MDSGNKMVGIVVYGSLLNSTELAGHDVCPEHIIPVKVRGYKRLFNQKPSWRKGSGEHIAVLNVKRASEAWINALCLYFSHEKEDVFASRESGYIREAIHIDNIECYPGHCIVEESGHFLYRGKNKKTAEDILPNHEYLDICVQGAAEWGEDFFYEFMATTYTACGMALPEYICSGKD